MLVEHLLRSSGKLLLAVRCCQEERLRQPRESAPRRNREFQRYLAAGACHAAVYRFPPSHADLDSFFMTDFMMDYSQAILIEGDRPFQYLDLSVYVTPPPPPGESLLRRMMRDHARQRAAGAEALERMVQTPEGLEKLLEAEFGGGVIASLNPDKKWLEPLCKEVLEVIEQTLQAPPPKPTEHWALSEGFQGIEQAQVVVINVRNAPQRERGEEMLRQVVPYQAPPRNTRLLPFLGPVGFFPG